MLFTVSIGSERQAVSEISRRVNFIKESRSSMARGTYATGIHKCVLVRAIFPSEDDLYFGTAVITEGPATMGRAPCSRGARYQMADMDCVHASHVLPPIAMTSLGNTDIAGYSDTNREH